MAVNNKDINSENNILKQFMRESAQTLTHMGKGAADLIAKEGRTAVHDAVSQGQDAVDQFRRRHFSDPELVQLMSLAPGQRFMNLTDEQTCELMRHLVDIEKARYESDSSKKVSIMRRALGMQIAITVMIAALFFIVPFLMKNNSGKVPAFVYVLAACMAAAILLSAVILTVIAQMQFGRTISDDFLDVEREILANPANILSESAQLRQQAILIKKAQTRLAASNNRKTVCLHSASILIVIAALLLAVMLFTAMYVMV